MSDWALDYLSSAGGPALFVVLVFGATGIPLPSTLLLVTTGALADQGDTDLRIMFAWASAGAVLGDQIGYWIGRLARAPVQRAAEARPALGRRLDMAKDYMQRWAGLGVFLTRWLLSPLGPAVNIASGILEYPWPRFSAWGITGEALWVALCLLLGASVGYGVDQLAGLVGNLSWLLIAGLATAALGWRLLAGRHRPA